MHSTRAYVFEPTTCLFAFTYIQGRVVHGVSKSTGPVYGCGLTVGSAPGLWSCDAGDGASCDIGLVIRVLRARSRRPEECFHQPPTVGRRRRPSVHETVTPQSYCAKEERQGQEHKDTTAQQAGEHQSPEDSDGSLAELERLEKEEAALQQGGTARVSTRTKRVIEETSKEPKPKRTKMDEAEQRVVIKYFYKRLGSPEGPA